ncbi:hypothetical protein HUJ04_010543 [Dendroctonus ponderosae]|nr:hypothetical protein HUJ04_010543 [Dendroctonus ponderosae]
MLEFPGCQQACKFHQEALFTAQQSQPVIHTKGEAVIQVSGAKAQWPSRPISVNLNVPVVYVVMRKSQTGPWRQIIQTLAPSTRVPVDQGNAMLRVLVVDPQGLLTIYSPDEESLKKNKKRKKTINTEIKATTLKTPHFEENAPWVLKEVSLIHQKVLVIGEIAWEPKTVRGVYLVTWEVDGGGLKGNLFTDSTCVTLSLWPDTIYHIQVELVSRIPGVENIKSQMMDLDTGRAQKVSTETDANALPEESPQELKSPLLSVLFSAVRGEKVAKSDRYYKDVAAALVECFGIMVVLVFVIVALRKIWNVYVRRRMNPRKLVEDFNSYPEQYDFTLKIYIPDVRRHVTICRGNSPCQASLTEWNPLMSLVNLSPIWIVYHIQKNLHFCGPGQHAIRILECTGSSMRAFTNYPPIVTVLTPTDSLSLPKYHLESDHATRIAEEFHHPPCESRMKTDAQV